MLFFPGWHNVNSGASGTKNFPRICISYNRIERRKSAWLINDWLLDCGFTRIMNGKSYPSTKKYARTIYRWANNGNLMGASTRDYPCFAEALSKTKLDIATHQALTIHRYHPIKKHLKDIHLETMMGMQIDYIEYATDCEYNIDNVVDFVESEYIETDLPYVIPILQGSKPQDYINHLSQYGDRVVQNSWIGVGSLKYRRNSEVKDILTRIKLQRPDLKLHEFGLSKKQLVSAIMGLLFSADSQAAGFASKSLSKSRKYENSNNPAFALAYAQQIDNNVIQNNLFNL